MLDLGCRDGALSSTYLDGNEVVGLDVDREALAHAEALGLKTEWADLDEPLAIEDGSFDVVVAGELLEHIRSPQQLIDEARRVLRPGGTLVGSDAERLPAQESARFAAGRHPEQDPTHLHLFRPGRHPRAAVRVRAGATALRRRALRPAPARLFANVIVFSGRKPR